MKHALAISSIVLLTMTAPASAVEGIRCGAKLVKADLEPAKTQPEVRVLENADQWRLLREEAWTGVNAHEFYFTLQADGNLPPPTVEVRWHGVRVERVLGADGKAEPISEGVRFKMRKGRAPTSVKTSLDYGSVHMAVFHNWEVRRAGNYRAGTWPTDAIQAQLNFLFAAREMCRAMGCAAAADPGFVGDIRLYGFETNFPNGHEDHPPHFHIMLAWPSWLNTQAGHFRLDDAGRILRNELQADDGKKVHRHDYGPGDVCPMCDRNGKVGFELIITEGGRGVIMRRAAGEPEYQLSPDAKTTSPVTAVEVSRRQTTASAWEPLCRVRATDDAARGEMNITVRAADGVEQKETIRYDPDTGEIAK
ncbi:MAG: hypothetical protein NTY01_19810 [Verrucomicrobia bacterium]|nr:hypothetical protein [Verrucomicrobiota bacterium]